MVEPKGDLGGKAFSDSEWVVEINERSVAKAMPLLSERAIYSEWGTEAKRRATMLYNRPISWGVDYYFINNLKGHTSRTDVLGGCFIKRKLKSKIDAIEEAMGKGDVYEPVDYVWMFKILSSKYQEPVGAPVVRVMQQLSKIEGIIFRELGGMGSQIRKVFGIGQGRKEANLKACEEI